MMLSGQQQSTGALNITAGVAAANTTCISNPGADVRLRIFSASMGNNPANAGKVRVLLRSITTSFVFGILAVGNNEAGDFLWFGEGGYPVAIGEGVEARHIASVAAQDFILVINFSQHWTG